MLHGARRQIECDAYLYAVSRYFADFELVEVNEAFAAAYIGCEKQLGLNREITNVNGSGIGIGHPVGATGTRLIITLLHAMKNRGKTLGLATLCGGGGVSMATVIEMM